MHPTKYSIQVSFLTSYALIDLKRCIVNISSIQACGGTFNALGGLITSPGFMNGIGDLGTASETECEWTLHAAPGNGINSSGFIIQYFIISQVML